MRNALAKNGGTSRFYARGFTLIELMIVVVIVGILAAIAYPSYQNQVKQTRRSDAQVALATIANQQERYFTECNYYAKVRTGTRACGAMDASSSILGLGSTLSPDGHYEITLVSGIILTDGVAVNASCATFSCGYTAVANPNGTGVSGRQSNDGRLLINSQGAKWWDRNNDADYSDSGENKWTK